MKRKVFYTKIYKFILAAIIITGLLPVNITTAKAESTAIDIGSVSGGGTGYTFSQGVVTITDAGDYTVTGNTIHNSLAVAGDIVGPVNLTLSGLSIRMADVRCPLSIGQNSSVNLILNGSNTLDLSNLEGANNLRGISTSPGVSLTISGEGSLSVMGQSAAEGIGAEGNITINSGTVNAWGGYSEGQSGRSGIRGANITINGGSVTATGGHGYGMASSGLGGGSITINGGDVTAYGGTSEYIGSGAGIGGGANYGGGTIVINGGHVTATGGPQGAGIGGGSHGSGGNITINGGTVIANGGTDAAGIGGGYYGGGGTIIITNLNGDTHVIATGLNGGAGIGGGLNAGYAGGNGGYIAISGGTIEAVGGNNGSAGIGSGNYGGDGGNITISGGKVSATGGYKAAGIGGGEYFSGGTINITGGEVTANGGDQGAGVGSGCNVSGTAINGGAITILGGTVNATGGVGGAGLGGGFDADGGSVAITEALVTATGRGGGAGIGGGPNSTQWGNGGTITLSSGRVTAVSHGGGAGIGGGWTGNAGNITINGGLITATADDRAPGIGSGGNSVFVTKGTNSVTINAGRVYATGSGNSDIGGDGNMSYYTNNTFNGGSIRAGSVNFSPKTSMADVYKTTVTVTNADDTVLADTDVAYRINGGESISSATDGSGKLCLWLPQTPGGGSTNILVSKGATEYSASGQVTNDNATVMTAIENTYEIGAISDQTMADLNEGYAGGSLETRTIRVTNTGTAALSNLSVTLESGKEAYFEIGVPFAAEIPVGGYADFTIKAKDALEVGDYTAAVTVQADRASNVSFTVSQKVKMLLIAFVNDGGSYAERSVHYNTSIGESGWPADPQKTGYTFGGWYTEANIRAIPNTVFTQPTSLDAKWTANTYMVIFDAQEGTVNPEDKTVTYDETYGVLPTPLKPGYTFSGWYTETGGAGQLITSSSTVDITSDITLYAKWTVNTYTVVYKANGGTGSTASSSHAYDTLKTLTSNGFARTGYTFAGWAASASGPVAYSNTQSILNLTSINNATVTLYAKWTANSYKVNFDAQEGTVSQKDKIVTYNETYGVLPAPLKPGYTFGGWYTKAGGAGKLITSSSIVDITSDITLYAKWAIYASAPPASVSAATAGYNSILITWNAVPGVSGYQVSRATSFGGAYSLIKTTASLSCVNTSLSTGKPYYYKVRTYRYVGGNKVYGDYSNIVSASPKLSSVTSATAVAYYPTSIKVSWSAVPGRTKYEVWRSTSATSGFALLKSTGSTSYKDTTCTPFVTYYYQIRAYRTVNGHKVYSASASATVNARPILGNVTGVKVAVSSPSGIKLSWSSVSGCSGYEIRRSTAANGTYTAIKTTSSRSYTDSNLTPNTTYFYQVIAYRTAGGGKVYSTPCSPVSAMPVFGSVSNAKAVRSSSTGIKLTWSAVSGRSGYEVYRSASPIKDFVLIKSTRSTSFTDSRLVTGVTYYYKIVAYRTVNGAKYRSAESVITATP